MDSKTRPAQGMKLQQHQRPTRYEVLSKPRRRSLADPLTRRSVFVAGLGAIAASVTGGTLGAQSSGVTFAQWVERFGRGRGPAAFPRQPMIE